MRKVKKISPKPALCISYPRKNPCKTVEFWGKKKKNTGLSTNHTHFVDNLFTDRGKRGKTGKHKEMKKLLDLRMAIAYTRNAIIKMETYSEEVCPNENDVSAEETLSCQGSWLPGQNEHRRRKKGAGCQKSKR